MSMTPEQMARWTEVAHINRLLRNETLNGFPVAEFEQMLAALATKEARNRMTKLRAEQAEARVKELEADVAIFKATCRQLQSQVDDLTAKWRQEVERTGDEKNARRQAEAKLSEERRFKREFEEACRAEVAAIDAAMVSLRDELAAKTEYMQAREPDIEALRLSHDAYVARAEQAEAERDAAARMSMTALRQRDTIEAERDALQQEVTELRGTPVAFLHRARKEAEADNSRLRAALERVRLDIPAVACDGAVAGVVTAYIGTILTRRQIYQYHIPHADHPHR